MMRQLCIIPVIHSAADLGKLQASVAAAKQELVGKHVVESSRQEVDRFWEELRSALARWEFEYRDTYLYQDGLPVVPDTDDHTLLGIIRELADKGSENHRLLAWLIDQGATPIGTEDPELLIREYNLAKRTLQLFTDDSTDNRTELRDNLVAQQRLLATRDQFIAKRIDATLPPNKMGILFLGMLHHVDVGQWNDIQVQYPFGRPAATELRFSPLDA
jgi:hypothetical protein